MNKLHISLEKFPTKLLVKKHKIIVQLQLDHRNCDIKLLKIIKK